MRAREAASVSSRHRSAGRCEPEVAEMLVHVFEAQLLADECDVGSMSELPS